MAHKPQPSVTPLDNGMYLISVPRGLHYQRRRRVALTADEARIVLAQLVGHLRRATRQG